MASSPGNPSMMPNSTASSFKPRSARSPNRLAHKSARPRSPISKAKNFEAFVFFTHAQHGPEALPAHVAVNAHQKVGPFHIKKLVGLALQRTTPPGFQLRRSPRHDARDLLGVVLMPQVLLRDPRQIPGRQSRQKSFR